VLVDVVGRADLLDTAVVHDDDAVSHLHRLFLVMGDEHRGRAHFVVQPAQPAPQVLAHLSSQGGALSNG
jgi:hypothetical protein